MGYLLLSVAAVGYVAGLFKVSQSAGLLRETSTYFKGQRGLMSALIISAASCLLGLAALTFFPM